MKIYAVYKGSSSTQIIESDDEGQSWKPFTVANDNIPLLVSALNAWHDEDKAAEQLCAELEGASDQTSL